MATKKDSSIISVEELEAQLEEKFGDHAATQYKNRAKGKLHRIRTGSLVLDAITGGGIPHGARVELTGEYSSGKSFSLYSIMEKIMLQDPLIEWIVFIDAENLVAQEHPTLKRLAALSEQDDIKPKLLLLKTGNARILYDQIVYIAQQKRNMVFILDSLSVLKIRDFNLDATKDKQKHVGDQQVGIDAKMVSELMSQYLAATAPTAKETHWSTLLFVNHEYMNIGGYGPNKITKGGIALTHVKEVQLDFKVNDELDVNGSKLGYHKRGEIAKDACGIEVEISTLKNQTYSNKRRCLTRMFFRDNNSGVKAGTFDKAYEILRLGLVTEAFNKTQGQAWYTIINPDCAPNGKDKFQGVDIQKLREEDPEEFDRMGEAVLKHAVSYWAPTKENMESITDEIEIEEEIEEASTSKSKKKK